jgi:threonine/homoserine/homoserine lactone efflux protein
MNIIIQGVILGFTLSILFGFGPALLALVQTSIHRGFWSGVLLAAGVFFSDLVLVGLSFLGAIKILENPGSQMVFGIVGGILLIIFGIVTYTRKVRIAVDKEGNEINPSKPGPLTYILKGFFINFTNPFVWFFWMGVVVGFASNYDGTDPVPLVLFFSGALGTIFFMDVLKSFSAYKIKKYVQTHSLIWINRIAGIGLLLFGIYLIFKSVFDLGL